MLDLFVKREKESTVGKKEMNKIDETMLRKSFVARQQIVPRLLEDPTQCVDRNKLPRKTRSYIFRLDDLKIVRIELNDAQTKTAYTREKQK